MMNPEIDVIEQVDEEVVEKETNKLVVINDDFNTFDHVIHTLVRVCKHTAQQAEQCAWIIHFRGKCVVKEGEYEKLKPMLDAIHDAGIGAEIQ